MLNTVYVLPIILYNLLNVVRYFYGSVMQMPFRIEILYRCFRKSYEREAKCDTLVMFLRMVLPPLKKKNLRES